ncbi:30S ribosomal protein S5 [Chlorella vulgaris]
MAAKVAHAMVAVPACTSGPRTSSTVRSSLRCFTAAVRGQSLQQQQRGQARSQRVAAQARAPRPGYNTPPADEEEQREEEDDSFQERVVQIRRVTKVVKGGKQLSFRAVVVVGDEAGTVGVGCASASEVMGAVAKAKVDAKRNLVSVPLNKNSSFPHKVDGIFGAAKVMLRPASDGTGVIAGGAVRVVLELAGVKNGFGKQLGTANPLNNARATLEGIKSMRTFQQVANMRGLPVADLMGLSA